MIVTGPSLTSSTCIFAAKTPVSTCTPCARSAAQNRSYSGSAYLLRRCLGEARVELPLRLLSAISVNWLTTSAAPPVSSRLRSNLPVLVLEDAQARDLAGEPLRVLARVAVGHAEQHAQAGADLATRASSAPGRRAGRPPARPSSRSRMRDA